MNNYEFLTIEENIQAELVEKKSKFISNLFYIESKQEAEKIIKEVKKKYFDAKHNCIAYRVIENNQIIEKSSDDGEPSGTAGMPMLNILKQNGFVNVLVIVTRYFGGILLGTGGLVRAYSGALTKSLDKSKKVKIHLGYVCKLIIEYNELEKLKYYCRKNSINIANIEYNENAIVEIEIKIENLNKVLEDFENVNIKIISKNEKYIKI